MHALGSAVLLPQPGAGDLAVPVEEDRHSVVVAEASGEGHCSLGLGPRLPREADDEREIRPHGHPATRERGRGRLEDRTGRPLAHPAKAFVVPALGSHEQSEREGLDGVQEGVREHVGRPRVVEEARKQPAARDFPRDRRRAAGVHRELVVHDVDRAHAGAVEMRHRGLDAVHDRHRRHRAPASAVGGAAERAVERTPARGLQRQTSIRPAGEAVVAGDREGCQLVRGDLRRAGIAGHAAVPWLPREARHAR